MYGTNTLRAVGEQIGSIFGPLYRRGATRSHPRFPSSDPRLAACALLLEIAYADGTFTQEERRHVEATVRNQFGLDACAARQLVAAAEEARAGSAQLWDFTGAVRSYSRDQKALLANILNDTADFDGAATTQEAYAVNKISSMMRVEPAYGAVGV